MRALPGNSGYNRTSTEKKQPQQIIAPNQIMLFGKHTNHLSLNKEITPNSKHIPTTTWSLQTNYLKKQPLKLLPSNTGLLSLSR